MVRIPGNREALIVGIDQYPGHPLSTCENDARSIEELLKREQYAFRTRTLVNKEATFSAFRSAIRSMCKVPAEIYLLYFSGHGAVAELIPHLLTVDFDEDRPGISIDQIRRLMEGLAPKSSSIALIFDCCHAGIPANDTAVTMLRGADVVAAVPGLPRGRTLIAACDDGSPLAASLGSDRSPFTDMLLRGLDGEASDRNGNVSLLGAYEYVCNEMERYGCALPVLRGDFAGSLILGRKVGAPRIHGPAAADLERCIREARGHVERIHEIFTQAHAEQTYWREAGHKQLCLALEPVLEWFARRSMQTPAFRQNSQFMRLKAEADQKLEAVSLITSGVRLARGIIDRKIGSGSFGTVWRISTEIGEPVAFKAYHSQDLALSEKISRFRRGYDAMRQLDHHNIVKVYEFAKCPLGFYMQCIDGANLRALSGSIRDEPSLIKLLLRIARTLLYAHSQGVVHRDVKPENIVVHIDSLNGEWHPYLTDFDLAWFSAAASLQTQSPFGVAAFASPEQFRSPNSRDAKAATVDVYGFGQLLFFLITGQNPMPFSYEENFRTLDVIAKKKLLIDTTAQLLNLYKGCTQFRVQEREQGFGPIANNLEQMLNYVQLAETELISSGEFETTLRNSTVIRSADEREYGFFTISPRIRARVHLEDASETRVRVLITLRPHIDRFDGLTSPDQIFRGLRYSLDTAMSDFPSARVYSIKSGKNVQATINLEVERSRKGITITRKLFNSIVESWERR